MKQSTSKSFIKVLDKEESLFFCSYPYTSRGMVRLSESNEKFELLFRGTYLVKALTLLAIVALTFFLANSSQGIELQFTIPNRYCASSVTIMGL